MGSLTTCLKATLWPASLVPVLWYGATIKVSKHTMDLHSKRLIDQNLFCMGVSSHGFIQVLLLEGRLRSLWPTCVLLQEMISHSLCVITAIANLFHHAYNPQWLVFLFHLKSKQWSNNHCLWGKWYHSRDSGKSWTTYSWSIWEDTGRPISSRMWPSEHDSSQVHTECQGIKSGYM